MRGRNRTSVLIDGWTFVLIAVFTQLISTLSGDEAAKYIQAELLFYLKAAVTCASVALLALKMFRSTAFSKQKDAEERGAALPAMQVTTQPCPPKL